MKQARQAPVFKPLSNTENASFFNFELQASHARTSAPVPFMRTNENQVSNVQKLTQNQDVGTERLSSLHAKLHQEADKIRKWKVQTEIELKQKEKKIQEASTTNESLRKSILELQLQNEDLSLKLQEEMGNREDVIQRISSTRQLCNILKDHAVKLEKKLRHCETERTELKYLEKEHLEQFEDLSSEFKKMEITSVENQNRLVNQLQLERNDRMKLEEELEAKLSEAEIQLKVLMDQCDEKDIEIRDVRTMLQRNDEKIHTLEQSIATLQERSERQIADIHCKESDLEATSEQLLCTQEETLFKTNSVECGGTEVSLRHCGSEMSCPRTSSTIMKEKLQYEEKLTEISVKVENLTMEKNTVEQNMVSSSAEYDAQIASLQKQSEDLNRNLLSEIEKVRKYEEQLAEMSQLSENLKSSRDILTLENTKLEGTVAALSKDVAECQKRIIQQNEVHACLTEDHRQLKQEQEECNAHSEQIKNDIEFERNKILQKEDENRRLHDQLLSLEVTLKQKEEVIQTSHAQCETTKCLLQTSKADIRKLQLALEEEKEKVVQAVKSLETINEEMATKSNEITSQDCSMNKLRKDYEKFQKDLQKTRDENEMLKSNLTKIEQENEQLTLKGEEMQKMIDDLKKEQTEHDKSLDVEMKSKSKQVSNMESKHKELKVEITSKNKQIKELEKEIKGQKSMLNSQTKATEAKFKEYTELQEQLEMVKLSGEKIQSNMNEELEAAKSNEKHAVKQMEEMKAKHEQSLKEKKQTEERCEFQLSEMMATMEKYNKENNKIVQQKEKELELLKSKTDEFSAQKKKKDSQYKEMKKSEEEMQASLEEALSEKKELVKRISSQADTVESLEKNILFKEAEMAQLQDKVKSLGEKTKQKKKTSTSHTQTSPATSPVSRINYKTVIMATTPQMLSGDDSTSEYQNAQTPQNCLKTPQRGILRNLNSVSKRRKVAFASHDDSGRHSASDSDSSTELMEVELESVESRYKTKSTPLVIRPSPKVRPSPKSDTHDIRANTSPKTPLTRVPRGPPVKLKDKKQVTRTGSVVNDEKEMFQQLFPDRNNDMIAEKENKLQKKEQDTTHVRKTPSKMTSKFFKASPKERILKKGKHTEKEEIAWFDLDSVFGFGPED